MKQIKTSEIRPNERLRQERLRRNWSQADVAEKIGSDPKTVGRWERGSTYPGFYLRQKLCELFDLDAQELGLVRSEQARPEETPEGPSTLAAHQKHIEVPFVPVSAVVSNEVDSSSENASVLMKPPVRKRGRKFFAWSLSSLVVLVIIVIVLWAVLVPRNPGNPYPGPGQLVINDALSSDTSVGLQHSNEQGSCLYDNGAFHSRAIHKTYFKPCMVNGIILHDFTYEVQMQITHGNCGGILFRSNFPLMYYFIACTNGQYRLVRYDRDNVANRKILIVQHTRALHTGLNATNILAVVAKGSHFDLFINEINVGQAQDNAYAEGQLGMLAHTCSIAGTDYDCVDSTEAIFTNLRVWKSS